ncbi:hypothetical protein GYB29_01765 [bacterium]|nr:hypothetical protein [bacterium]
MLYRLKLSNYLWMEEERNGDDHRKRCGVFDRSAGGVGFGGVRYHIDS